MITKTIRLAVVVIVLIGAFSSASIAGSWQQNISIGGFNSVNIYTPDSDSSIGQGKALLLVLHGCVQPISSFLTANLEDAAEAHGMVVAVPDAVNKAGFSCWSYWQGAINRNSGDYANLINLSNTLSQDASRNIDADQVYVSGLSSGAAFAAQAACVAPDVFAGVAPSAGPTIGTSSNGAISTCESVSASTFKSRCESYAGAGYQSYFSTQIAVVGHGDADTTVSTCYNQQNANGYANLYNVSAISGSSSISEGAGHTAQQSLWDDNRVSMLWFNGLDHSWSGGTGASGSYVAGDSINFATYLGDFFAQNNLRVDRNQGPTISNHNATVSGSSLSISGTAVDSEGTVGSVTIEIFSLASGEPVLVETLSSSVNPSNDTYSAQSTSLPDGLYQMSAYGTDNESAQGESTSVTVRIGDVPPNTAPVISNTAAIINGQCATISGTVVDLDQNLASVSVVFSNTTLSASITGNTFEAEACNLPGGNNAATITATDSLTLSSTETINFVIDAGITGDYNLHISEGHITWGVGYSACYLAFGTSDFTMRETPSGSQCQWIADGAAQCAGPVQNCSSGGGGSTDADQDGVDDAIDNCPNIANSDQADNDNDGLGNVCDSTPNGSGNSCTEIRSSNYSHVSNGRATSNGFSTFAVGSNDSMGYYSFFSFTTLIETSTGYFELGDCN